MSDKNHEQNQIHRDSRIVEKIKAEVIEAVMSEVRPLLLRLAELADSQKNIVDRQQSAVHGLQSQAATRLADLQSRITERINAKKANMAKYIKR